MEPYFYQCPYCWENISILLDPGIHRQELIEDCEVCCNPIQIKVAFINRELAAFDVSDLGQ